MEFGKLRAIGLVTFCVAGAFLFIPRLLTLA